MTKNYPSLPAKINCKISELSTHEYWGKDYAEGKAEYLLIQKENGRYILLITCGSWKNDFTNLLSDGIYSNSLTLDHTQTRARTYGKAICIVNKDTAQDAIDLIGKDNKIATWALK